ncbi:MAG: ImmA/IrrE family metallo-endopeptidase [Alphaproteobacteria bacterium]|nr:ImmA/IrrE family metallo-endopeptidase [Alphaproteobacteria bacterium]
MAKEINPQMIILARESRGIVQSELAKNLGISQSKLSKAEKGCQSLPDGALDKLCNLLDYPHSFFYQNAPTTPVSHYYYRKRITIPQRTIIQIDAIIQLLKKQIDSLIEAIELPINPQIIYDPSEESPAEIARKVRYLLNIPKNPINNLVNIIENQGILVIKTDLIHEKIDAISSISDKGARLIFLNSMLPNDRQRFSLAHEFGHMIMHMENIPSLESEVEIEANNFASEFLMPEDEITDSLRNLTFSKLGDLKRYWKVSMKALLFRAKQLNTINDNAYRNFQIMFSKEKINKNEPIPLPEEQPYLLKEIIKLHHDVLGYSNEELCKILHINNGDFEERFSFSERPKLRISRRII